MSTQYRTTANPLVPRGHGSGDNSATQDAMYSLVDPTPQAPPRSNTRFARAASEGSEGPHGYDDPARASRLEETRRAKKDHAVAASVLFCLVVSTILWLLYDLVWSHHPHHHHPMVLEPESPALFLVETLPLENFTLPLTPGSKHTHEVLEGLVNGSTSTLDVTVMYWNLLALNADSDDDVATPASCPALGCSRGASLYRAFESAARRGVRLRFLNDNSSTSLGHVSELDELASAFPEHIQVGRWNANRWYGGGIMHMKLWVADGKHAYVGSANMDWLSLAQVKELGVVAYNASQSVAGDAQHLFETWWSFSSGKGDGEGHGSYNAELPSPQAGLGTVVRQEPTIGAGLLVPCWEPALASAARCAYPLAKRQKYSSPLPTWQAPAPLAPNPPGGSGGSGGGGGLGSYFLSGAPAAVLGECGATAQGHGSELRYVDALYGCARTWDLDGILNTIGDAKEEVSLSVMDLWPSNPYSMNTTKVGGRVWWPALFDALTASVGSSGTRVRVLVSWWAHSNPQMITYLKAFSQTCAAVSGASPIANGTLEVRIFEVPGWQDTTGTGAAFPAYSRVNHAKYVVTDRRANVGTSNMQWGYYYNTAGASFNTDDSPFVATVQAAFDRDWASAYATPLDAFAP